MLFILKSLEMKSCHSAYLSKKMGADEDAF